MNSFIIEVGKLTCNISHVGVSGKGGNGELEANGKPVPVISA